MRQLCSHLFKHIPNNFLRINSSKWNCLIETVHDLGFCISSRLLLLNNQCSTMECPLPFTLRRVAVIILIFFASFISGNWTYILLLRSVNIFPILNGNLHFLGEFSIDVPSPFFSWGIYVFFWWFHLQGIPVY